MSRTDTNITGIGITTVSGIVIGVSGVAQGYLTGNKAQVITSGKSVVFSIVSGEVAQGINVYKSSILNTANQAAIGSVAGTVFDSTYGYASQDGSSSNNDNNS